jgi:hypothetical protein
VADIQGGSDDFGDFEGPDGVDVPMFDHRKSTSKLTTSGLTNCVAIVASHHGSGEAVLWHLNSFELFVQDVDAEAYDAEGEPVAVWHLSPPVVVKAKQKIDAWLGHADGVTYAIALGTQWKTGVATSQRRDELTAGLHNVFAPTQLLTSGQDKATWDPATRTLT